MKTPNHYHFTIRPQDEWDNRTYLTISNKQIRDCKGSVREVIEGLIEEDDRIRLELICQVGIRRWDSIARANDFYLRDSDGEYKLDSDGDKLIDFAAAGKFYKEHGFKDRPLSALCNIKSISLADVRWEFDGETEEREYFDDGIEVVVEFDIIYAGSHI